MSDPKTKVSDTQLQIVRSEPFRNELWRAVCAIPLAENGPTVEDLRQMLWDGNDKTKEHAKRLDSAISDYCYEVAMSTAQHFNCSLQIFDEDINGIWESCRYAKQFYPEQLAAYRRADGSTPFAEWNPPHHSDRFDEEVHKAAEKICSKFGLTMNASQSKSPAQQTSEALPERK